MGSTVPLDLDAVAVHGPSTRRGCCRGGAYLDDAQRRQVLYVGLGWDLLISAHPDTSSPTACAFARPDQWSASGCSRDVVRGGHLDPSYAVNFWDLTNRQDWAAVESVQRGLATRRSSPGLRTQ